MPGVNSTRTLTALFGRLPLGCRRNRTSPSPRLAQEARSGAAPAQSGRTETSSPAFDGGAVRVGNGKQGREARVPCAVSDLVGVSAADDGTTCGAHRGTVAQQLSRGTGR